MPVSGDEIRISEQDRIRFLRTAADTDGELLEVEVTYPPQSERPSVHYHPHQEERFEVFSGVIRAQIGEEAHEFQAGDQFVVPAGQPHWMHNASDEPARVNWQTRPALRTEVFFETVWNMRRDGKFGPQGPNLLQAVVIGQEYSEEFRLLRPAYGLQRAIFAVLVPLGRLLGYRGRDP
jgi:quercetin dioxygenase-like cupin family protein